jgi:hypothetical protein
MQIRVVFVFVFLKLAAGQSPAPPQAGAAWTEHYRRATVSIGRVQEDHGAKVFQVLGTGVIVAPDAQHAFLVTAKHVFDDPKANWHPADLRVRFAQQENKAFSEELGAVLTLKDQTGKNVWSVLADESDIAAMPVPATFRGYLTDAVGFQDFATSEDVFDGAGVFVFGYPGDSASLIGPNGLVRAITRSGVIAWTDPHGALDNPLLLDSNLLPGNSGGPAFKVPTGLNKTGSFAVGGRVAFLGVVSAGTQMAFTVQADGRLVLIKFPDLPLPSTEQVIVTGLGAMARIEPAAKVKRLVESMLH